MFAVTIIAANYAHFARALATSFLEHNPGSTFYALLLDVDKRSYSPTTSEPFSVLTPRDLSLDPDEFRRMALMYDVTELATALKPWALETLLDMGADVAVYLDPDIFVYSSLSNIEISARKTGIVLTPHGIRPMERDGKQPSEADIMQSGIYNLGFIALNETNRDFLSWWQTRLLRDSISAPDKMLFTDQRWIDLVPGYWDVAIMRDSGLNVAYWNVDKRPLTESAGTVFADGSPLTFFHFSGFDARKPWILSKHAAHSPRVLLSADPVLAKLCDDYAEKLEEFGASDSAKTEYVFGRLSSGQRITPALRRLYRDRILEEDRVGTRVLPTPFGANDNELLKSLVTPLDEQPLLNEFMLSVWRSRGDVATAFPHPLTSDARGFNIWCRTSGITEGMLEEWQVIVPATKGVQKARTSSRKKVTTRGVNIHGYLTAELGMGELGRLVVRALDEARIPYSPVVNNRHLSRNQAEFHATRSVHEFPVDVVVINADQIHDWAREAHGQGRSPRPCVGVWAWEVEDFPATFDSAFDFVDEVWAISRFSQRAIERRSPKPVFTIPLPQHVRQREDYEPFDFASLGLPSRPYFLAMFDYLSVIERKNPFAVIDAFVSAFDVTEDVQLIIKTINGSQRPLDRERLLYAARRDSRIHVIEEYLSSAHVTELMAGALAYVSLHRSEGYGLTCSEAMSLHVPVIATGYSGNVDFMDETNSLLVPFALVAVDPSVGVYPSSTVWAEPDTKVASDYMRRIVDDPEFARGVGETGFRSIRDSQTTAQAAEFVSRRLDELLTKSTVARTRRNTRGLARRLATRLPEPLKVRLRGIRARIRRR